MRTWQDYKTTFPKDQSIFDAARSGDLQGLRDLILSDHSIDLNQKNPSGFTPLMLAVYSGQKDFCEALLRAGVCVESKDNMHNSVLMAASFKGNLEIVKLLLNSGANPKLMNASSMNAYDWALMFGRKNITEYYQTNNIYEVKKHSKLKSIFKFLMLMPTMMFKKRRA